MMNESESTLAELCQLYWFPLYGFVRRSGKSREEAEDLTQGFFAQLLRLDTFSRADAAKGKLRTFLLKALKDHLAHERDRQNAQKRGGGIPTISLDLDWAEDQFKVEPADPAADPERQFERRWAIALLTDTFAQLESEYTSKGKAELYHALQPHLMQDAGSPLAEIASQLGMREGALKVAAHRLRQRFKKIFRQNIADTLADNEDLDTELRAITAALSR